MIIGKTYLKNYSDIIKHISSWVNTYLKNNNLGQYKINLSFYLRFLSNKDQYYQKIVIHQKGKERILYQPSEELKYIQKYILHLILNPNRQQYKLASCVTGFTKNQSILTNAMPHLNRVAIIKFDLKDFFPSISREMIHSIFRKYNHFDYTYSYILSHLVTYKNELPQGAPTSPFLANICASGIDYKILKLIKKINISHALNIEYTRYADDLTISFDKKFDYDYVINAVIDIVFSEGFYPNFKKIKVLKKHQCQKVTGIILNNNVPTIEKKEREKIKFILKIWENYGIDDAIQVWNNNNFGTRIQLPENSDDSKNITQKINYSHVKFKEILLGKINFFNMVNATQNENIFKQLNMLLEE